jgi:hypothetical protein
MIPAWVLPGDRRTRDGILPPMTAIMTKPIPPSSAVARALDSSAPLSLPAAFSEQLSNLYQLVQRSHYVFGSPIGPFYFGARQFHLPRFVYFGPNASDASLRLAFLGGFDHRDLRSTLAMLRLIEGLALRPDLGQGLNLSFFPLIDVLGLAQVEPVRGLNGQSWLSPTAPEIALLERESRQRAFHGFVRLETAPAEDLVTIRLRSSSTVENVAPALELISSEDVSPLQVRWESELSTDLRNGPLEIADDLPMQPFELIVRLPASWSLDYYAEAAASILKRFVLRYRGFISYAQHL